MKHLNLKRLWAVIIAIVMMLQLLPITTIADAVDDAAVVEPVEDTVALAEEEPTEPPADPEEPAVDPEEPAVEPDEPIVDPEEPIVDPDEPVVDPDEPVVDPDEPVVDPDKSIVDPDEPIIDPDEPVVDPDEPVVPTENPEEPEAEPFTVEWNGYEITVEGAPEETDIQVRGADNYNEALQQLMEEETVETLFVLSLSKEDVKLDSKVTVTVSGEALNDLEEGTTLAEINTNGAVNTVGFEYVEQDEEADEPAAIVFRTATLDSFALILPGEEELTDNTDEEQIDEEPDVNPNRGESDLQLTWDFKWLNGGGSTSGNYHYVDNEKTYLLFHPQQYKGDNRSYPIKADLQVHVHVAGSDNDKIPVGRVHIEIPAGIFFGWDGKKADRIDFGTLPQKPAQSPDVCNYWWYEGTNDNNEPIIIIENWGELHNGDKFTAQLAYNADPLDINGGCPDEEAAFNSGAANVPQGYGSSAEENVIDRYCWNNLYWKDYFVNDNVKCRIQIRNKDNPEIIDEEDQTTLSVGVMTRGGGSIKNISTQNDPKNGIYLKWQNSWGAKPSDADDYFYVVWNVQSWKWSNARGVQPWESDVTYANDDVHPAITIGEQTFTGEYVGKLRSGQWQINNHNNTTYRDYRILRQYSDPEAYTNIAGSNNTLFKWMGSSHLGASETGYKGEENGFSVTYTSSLRTWYSGVHYAVLVRYPYEEIVNACNAINPDTGKEYVDLANDGLPIIGRFNMNETWASGYQPVRTNQGSTRLFLRNGSGKGVFSKVRADRQNGIVNGAQTILAQYNKPIQLPYVILGSGVSQYPYRMSYEGTSATQEDRVLGQRIVITEEKLMLSSGNATHRNGWSPEGPDANAYPTGNGDGNLFLEDADYSIPRFNVVTFNEYYGSGAHGFWEADGSVANDYQNYPYLLIYTRTAGETTFEPYCAVQKVKTPNEYKDNAGTRAYLWNGEKNADGTPVLGAELQLNNYAYRIDRENVVQIQYVVETPATPADAEDGEKYGDYYRTSLAVSVHVKLNPTERVKEQIDKDLLASCDTYVKNIASCKVYDVETNRGTSEPRISVDNVGRDNAADVIIKLNRLTDEFFAEKNAVTPVDDSDVQKQAAAEGKQIAYIVLYAENSLTIDRSNQNIEDVCVPYKLLKGTFYDLLPKGTTIASDSIIGVYYTGGYSGSPSAGVYPTLQNCISQNRTEEWVAVDSRHQGYIFTSGFSYRTKYIPELDRNLLIIDYEIADPGNSYLPSGENGLWQNAVSFHFILENSFLNIRANGVSTRNFMGYEFTKEDGVANTKDNCKVTKIAADVRAPFQEIADRNEKSAFTWCNVTWNALTVLESGFTKMVSNPETLNGLPQPEQKTNLGRVSLGNLYQYRLFYTTQATTKSDQIVFYDIIESGTSGSESHDSDWKGTFSSLDISQIKELPDAENANVKCDPIVYYSTTLTEKVALNQPWTDLEGGFWTRWDDSNPPDPTTVTAIAVDCRKGTNGDSFHMAPKTAMVVKINMIAPNEMPEDPDATTVNGAIVLARDYDFAPPEDPTQGVEPLMSWASVMLQDIDISLAKASNPQTGTSSARTIVKADGTGTIVYRLTVRNNMPFDCENVVITDPIPEGLTIDRVTVKLNGASAETDASSTIGFTYELGADGRTCTFTIDKQYPTILDDSGAVTTNKDTEIYIYTTVDSLLKDENDPDSVQVMARNYDNTATLVSANGKEINEPTDTMYHRAETTLIPVEKIWDDADDQDGLRPTTIDVTLTGKAGNDTVVTETTTLNEQNSWKDSFENLPKYDIDDSNTDFDVPTTYTEIVYTISEEQVEHYEEPVIDNENYTITNKHVPELTEVSANKKWKNANGTVVPPAGAKVTYTLYADGQPTEYKVELKGTAGTAPTAMGGYESEAWTAKFVNLPKYRDHGTEIVYTIAETVTYGGYTPSTTEPVADGATITNTQETTEISANKKWKNANGTVVPPEGAKVTYTLYADGQPTEYTVELKGEAGTAPTVTGGYESVAWTAKFVNLPKYKPGTTTLITYTVKETVTYGGYTPSTTQPVANGGTITNTQEVTEAFAKKAWKNLDGSTTPPENATVTYTLYADGQPTEYTVELKGEVGTAPTVTGGYESEAWTAKFVNLPKYQPGTTTLIVYTIAETVTYPGYEASTTEPVANGGTITNTQKPFEVAARKAWKNADGSTTPPAGAKVTYTLYADGQATSYTVELKGEVGTKPTVTGGYESEAWVASFVNLPEYKPGTTTKIVYTIAETVTYDGYTPSTTEPVANGATITNTQETTEISANKKWKNANGTVVPPAGAKVTYTLYADGQPTSYTVELKGEAGTAPTVTGGYESEEWTAKFVNLPKYKPGTTTLITYTVKETVTYGGYTPSTTEPVANGGTITNTQETTEISAHKAWKNANGTFEPPTGATVTYTLYADGQPTEYTVELKGEVGTAPTVTGGYESEEWTAKFVNLPKYQPGTDTLIVYTIAETVTYGGYTPSTTEPVADGETITNTQEATEISAHKAWKNANGSTTPPEGATVTFTLYADGQPTEYTVVLKGEADEVPTGTKGYESEAWTAKFINLQKYQAGTDTEIVYTVKETVTYGGYTPDKKEPVGNDETITNTEEATEISAHKAWKNADGTFEPPAGATVTFTLVADGTETEYVVVLKGEADEVPTGTAGYESEAWTAKFINLPKYQAGTDTEIVYTVKETVTYGGYTPDKEEVADGETITNEQDSVEISAHKAWKNADGTTTPPEGAKVTYTLYADGVATSYTVELKGEAGEVPTGTAGYESEAWTAKFINLPKYQAGTDTEIVYTVKETVKYDGYTPDKEEVANGGTITNEQETTEIYAKKAWKNWYGVVIEPPEGATVTFTLLADGVETAYTVELKGAVGTKPTVTGGYESEAWVASFVNLPKYQPGTTTEIVYTIAETVTYLGYVPESKDPVANGGTITNKDATMTRITIKGQKIWKDDNNLDGLRPSSITIHLFADGVEINVITVTADVGWTFTFTDLPKTNEKGEVINYTITEDEVDHYKLEGIEKEEHEELYEFKVTNFHTPQTGDNAKPWLWITILSLSVLAGAALLIVERKSRKRSNG